MSAFHDAIRAIIAQHVDDAVHDHVGDPVEDWDDRYPLGDYYVTVEVSISPIGAR